jgi:hypothetical protein
MHVIIANVVVKTNPSVTIANPNVIIASPSVILANPNLLVSANVNAKKYQF